MTTPGTTNGFDSQKTKSYVDRIENIEAEIASERGKFMARCKELRKDISDVLDEAKSDGIPKKALRAVIKTRAIQAKIENIREDLEGEDQDNYDLIRHAIGDLADLPLGKAALERAAAAVDSLTETLQ